MLCYVGLLFIVGWFLFFYYKYFKCVFYRYFYLQDEIEVECFSDDCYDWWWYCLEGLCENVLVIIVNVVGQLDLFLYFEVISFFLLDGFFYWFICLLVVVQDFMFIVILGIFLFLRQLVFEVLVKMSILEFNVDIIFFILLLMWVDELYIMLV